MNDRIAVFDSSGEAYKRSFQVFLENTDQKTRARRWLENFLATLPKKRVLIDADAGSREVTAWLSPSFEKTIAVEPNPFLLKKLQAFLPDAETICQPILEAAPSKADLVLCSHTLLSGPLNMDGSPGAAPLVDRADRQRHYRRAASRHGLHER